MSINEEDKGRSSEIKDQLSNEILQKLPKSCMQSSLGYFTHALRCAFIVFYRAFLSIVINSPALLHIVFSIKAQHLSVLSQGFWKIKGTPQAAEAESMQLGVMTLSPHCWQYIPREWHFSRCLVSRKGKDWKLIPARLGTCLPERDFRPLQHLVWLPCRSDWNGERIMNTLLNMNLKSRPQRWI